MQKRRRLVSVSALCFLELREAFFGILQNLNSNHYFKFKENGKIIQSKQALCLAAAAPTLGSFSHQFSQKILGKENPSLENILHLECATKKTKASAVARNQTSQRHFITTATVDPGLMTYALVL